MMLWSIRSRRNPQVVPPASPPGAAQAAQVSIIQSHLFLVARAAPAARRTAAQAAVASIIREAAAGLVAIARRQQAAMVAIHSTGSHPVERAAPRLVSQVRRACPVEAAEVVAAAADMA